MSEIDATTEQPATHVDADAEALLPSSALSWILPALSAVATSLAVLVCVGILDENSTKRNLEHSRAETAQQLATVRAATEKAINQTVHLASGLKAYVTQNPDMTREEFASISQLLMDESAKIRSVTSIKDNIINDVYPREGNEKALGLDLSTDPLQMAAAQKAIDTKKPWLAGPVELKQGGYAFIYRVPVLEHAGPNEDEGRYWGMVSILIDKQTLYDEITDGIPHGLTVAIKGRTTDNKPSTVIFGSESILEDAFQSEISLPNGNWDLFGWPEGGWPTASPYAAHLRALGVLLAGLAGGMVYLVLRSNERYREYACRLEFATAALKKSTEEMAVAKSAAEDANRAKSQFLANMSHEIRTPLSAVIGITELLQDTTLQPDQRNYMNLIHESGESLLTVINDILDFSKIEAGKLDLVAAPFNLREAVGDMMKPMGLRAGAKQVELTFHVAADVPQILSGDSHRLRQVLINLVGNAIKFTEQGEIAVDVSVTSQEPDSCQLQFLVRDTGIGIPDEKRSHVFQAFEQAEGGISRRFGGTGLGLAICSRLVEMMGGRIWVESEFGVGSRFIFTAQFGVVAKDFEPDRQSILELQGSKILIVDDLENSLMILDEMVSRWGMIPTKASSAGEAIAALKDAHAQGSPFQLMLTDVHMPNHSGFDLVSEIRSDDTLKDLPVIACTAYDQPGDHQRWEDLQVKRCLLKPVKESELFDVVLSTLGVMKKADEKIRHESDELPAVRPLKILLAEDNLVNQKLGISLLEKWGHSVTLAANGREAVEQWRTGDHELVLMDVQMPEMDGLDATGRIRDEERSSGNHIPIIALTAHALTGDQQKCLEAGMDGYVSKPLRISELRKAIHGFFEAGLTGRPN